MTANMLRIRRRIIANLNSMERGRKTPLYEI